MIFRAACKFLKRLQIVCRFEAETRRVTSQHTRGWKRAFPSNTNTANIESTDICVFTGKRLQEQPGACKLTSSCNLPQNLQLKISLKKYLKKH